MSKKGQGLSISTVIIIILCLLVLGVVIYMLINSAKEGNNALSCPTKGGICMQSCTEPYGPHPDSTATCGTGDKSCKLVLGWLKLN